MHLGAAIEKVVPMVSEALKAVPAKGLYLCALLRLQRQAWITTWAEQTYPIGDPLPGDPREFEKKRLKVAKLSPLGRKLLGIDRCR
jgi:hypothetical protein